MLCVCVCCLAAVSVCVFLWLSAALLLLCVSAHTQGAPKMKVAIVGGGLAGLSTAVELLDQG